MPDVRPSRFLLLITVCSLLIVGCGGRSVDWDAATPEQRLAEDINKRVVLFAPLALGPLQQIYPEARTQFATDLAKRVNTFVADANAWASATLPASDSAAWAGGPVGAARGAEIIVLTEILSIEGSGGGLAAPGTVTATVRMRALNALGQEAWHKTVTGRASAETSPKFQQAGSQPGSKAAWDACKKNLIALKTWLDQLSGVVIVPPIVDDSLVPTIRVPITSLPEGADILIDGEYKGNTPTQLSLPAKEIEVRIERQGFQPWSRRVVPTPEMTIQPALHRLGEAEAPVAPVE